MNRNTKWEHVLGPVSCYVILRGELKYDGMVVRDESGEVGRPWRVVDLNCPNVVLRLSPLD